MTFYVKILILATEAKNPCTGYVEFLAPTGELYELLCHRKRKMERENESTNGLFFNNSECTVLIWTKFGMTLLLNHRNKPAEFFDFHKIQDGHHYYSKLRNRS